jgi:hypothetical protein
MRCVLRVFFVALVTFFLDTKNTKKDKEHKATLKLYIRITERTRE